MRTNVILVVASVAAVVGTATGADVLIGALATSTAGAQLDHFNSEGGGLFLPGLRAQTGVIGAPGGVQGESRTLNFGVNGTARVQQSASSATHAFYLGTASGLAGVQNGWFNTVGGIAPGSIGTVGADTTVLGFGNGVNNGLNFSANRVEMNFAPGVQGFAFNFADISDVSDAELVVRWNDGTESVNMLAGITNTQTGFFSLIAEAGRTIDRMVFRQTLVNGADVNGADVNDGFLLYGFSTLTVVPLPPAAWAGLAMLGCFAGVRKLRRR